MIRLSIFAFTGLALLYVALCGRTAWGQEGQLGERRLELPPVEVDIFVDNGGGDFRRDDSWLTVGCSVIIDCLSDADEDTSIMPSAPAYGLEYRVTATFQEVRMATADYGPSIRQSVTAFLPPTPDWELEVFADSSLESRSRAATPPSWTLATANAVVGRGELGPRTELLDYNDLWAEWTYNKDAYGTSTPALYTLDTYRTFQTTFKLRFTRLTSGVYPIFSLASMSLTLDCELCGAAVARAPAPPSYPAPSEAVPISREPSVGAQLSDLGLRASDEGQAGFILIPELEEATRNAGISLRWYTVPLAFGAVLFTLVCAWAASRSMLMTVIAGGVALSMATGVFLGIPSAVGLLVMYAIVGVAAIMTKRWAG